MTSTLKITLVLLLFCQFNEGFFSRRKKVRGGLMSLNDYLGLHPENNDISTAPRYTVFAPDLLRTDSEENIFLQVDGQSSLLSVTITILDFTKTILLLLESVTLNQENDFQAKTTIQLPSESLNPEEKKNKFVYLQVDFGGFHVVEKLLMVSFHSGYIFIQTDKPVYNPGEVVYFRTFVSNPSFKAFDASISLDIQDSGGVVVKQLVSMRAADGVLSDTFTIFEFANEGTWKIIAKLDHWPQNTFTAQFEVKKYVLPAFNVTLTPKKTFIDLEDQEFAVEISARYLFGEPVQGTAYVVFGVKINKEMQRLPSVKQVSDLDGGVVTLSMDEIKRAYPDVRTLVGHSVYVKASVLTTTGGDLVEAEKTGIKIVESPYVISFRDTPKYFKPGLPFDLTVQVSHHDGSPAKNVLVSVSLMDDPLVVSSGTARATINMPRIHFPQTIIARTTQHGLKPTQQADTKMVLLPYRALNLKKQNYIHISAATSSVSVGDRLSLNVKIVTDEQTAKVFSANHITYLVVNKGKIITAQRMDVTGQLLTAIGLIITPEMMPSFRFVAFYSVPWSENEEVVSDSIWVDVTDTCVGGLKVGPVAGVHRDYAPGKSFRFQVKGDPGAKVSLVAVDNAVFLLNKERLTQRKLWNMVEQGDIGCTRGGGIDAKGVFTDAGLSVSSSTGFSTKSRQDLQCPGSARRRRSAELLRRKEQLESHYKEKLQHRCCKDGLRAVPMPYSCTRRSYYITEGWECIRAFRYCCSTYRDEAFDTEIPTTPPPTTTTPPTTSAPRPTFAFHFAFADVVPVLRTHVRDSAPNRRIYFSMASPVQPELHAASVPVNTGLEGRVELQKQFPEEVEEEEEEEEWEYLDETDVYVRSRFFESWLWKDVNLPSKAEADGFASETVDHILPDSITEWGIMAISSSLSTGFCVAEPYNVRSWKRFFVDLKLPHSVARNEQVEIKAVIHNYDYENLRVRVVLMKTEDICSIAFKDKHTQDVSVPAGSSVAVPYTIMPLVVGKLPLEVMILAKDYLGDRVQKNLRVVMEGVQKTEVKSAVLNPSAEGGTQTVIFDKVSLESVVPHSVPETFINIRGNILADSIDNSISEDSLASLIQMPGGCVEQNLARMTLPLIATLYLDRTNNWESVGVERRAEALSYITKGYQNQLAYKKPDGSYPPYRREGASTWITAYVVKVFSVAHTIVGIQKQQVCEPLIYLAKNKYRHITRTFVEDNPVYSTTMTGGLRGDDPEITLTAFVMIALAEAKQAGVRCSDPDVNMESIIHKVENTLRKALVMRGRRPYTVAIASYALTLLGTDRFKPTQELLAAASPDRTHWPDAYNTLFTLEATGYALLALMKLKQMQEAATVFEWLSKQRRRGGGYGSTQSTMVVLQALSEYEIHKPPVMDNNLDVDVKIKGRQELRYHFNPTTNYAARSSRMPLNVGLEVEARGGGQGILEMVTYYNQVPEVDEKKPCEYFELNVAIEESSEKPPADVEKSFQITIKVRALGPRDVRMVILDISLPTGFTPENSDLEMLSNSVDRYINNFQIVDNLSDRGSLILHLFKVSHKEQEILIFRLQQRFKVGNLQPSSVTV
ncbi:complement C3-like [Cynoglossus semilaevis]|uniref:complement C3-like n=1 Tax=Cynoglossus semilaevis TaxID=244447 RepID=UPI000D62462D|nr:complement C3-like [Cynoglossus semilaevis]